MALQHNVQSFTDLQTLSRSDLREVLTEKLAEISFKALENCNNTEQVFKFWTEEILNVYNFADFDTKILDKILCAFADYTIQAIPNSAINCITEKCFDLITLNLVQWQSILSKLDSNLQSVAIVLTIITCTLRVLVSYYTFIKNSKAATAPLDPFFINGLKTAINNTQHFQRSILSVILDNPTYFVCHNISDFPAVANVMECLINVGRIVPALDIRLTAEIWKTISKVSSENAEFMTTTGRGEIFLSKGWPIQFLCEQIRKGLHDVYQCPNINSEIVEKILKISSFYLKLLIKFASDYSYQYFVNNDEVINTVVNILSPPENLRSAPVNTLITQYLTIGFINLISLIYKNREFAELICKMNIDSEIRFEAFFNLSSEVLKLLILDDTASVHLYLTGNLIEKIFNGVITYPIILLQKVNYESLVTTISTLMLSVCNERDLVASLEKCLIRGVLQNDLLLATICIDIWHTLLRFIDGESRYEYFIFWYNRCVEFPLLSNEPRAIYVNNLLRNLYNILPKSFKNRFCQFVMCEKNFMKPLIIFGYDEILNKDISENIKMRLISEVKFKSKEFSSKISGQDYFTLLENSLIIGRSTPKLECEAHEQVIQLFMKLLKISINEKQTNLHIAFIIYMTKHIKKYSKTQLLNIIILLAHYWVHFKSTHFKLCVLIFLNELRQIEQSEPLQSLIKSVHIDSQILVRSTARALFSDRKDLPIQGFNSNSEIKQFLREVRKMEFTRRCYKDISNQEINPAKRLKMDVMRNELQQILCNVNNFANAHKDVEFSTSDLAVMNEIKNIFVRFCNK